MALLDPIPETPANFTTALNNTRAETLEVVGEVLSGTRPFTEPAASIPNSDGTDAGNQAAINAVLVVLRARGLISS